MNRLRLSSNSDKFIIVLLSSMTALASCGGENQPASTGSGGNGGTSLGGSGTQTGGTTGGALAAGGTTGGGGSTSAGGSTASAGGSAGTSTTGGGSGTGGGGTSGGTGGAPQGGAGGAPVTCPSPALQAGDTNETVMVGGASRSYVLHVPAAYDASKPTPLIVDFHPLGGSGPNERTGSPYPAETDEEGVIMAFPSGLSGPSGGAWNVGPCCVKNTDDVEFAKALVEQVKSKACIDPKRVYAVGFSMGGGMSHYLACHAADVFAAVAPAAFDLLEENVEDCTPARPISVVAFRGTNDVVVPYAGGYSAVVSGMPVTFLGAEATFAKWAELNQCTGAASAADANNCKSYSGCQGDVDVMLCTQQNGGHAPGDADVAWPILKQHLLP
jgi:polyhydroxybutyrate depolymerase